MSFCKVWRAIMSQLVDVWSTTYVWSRTSIEMDRTFHIAKFLWLDWKSKSSEGLLECNWGPPRNIFDKKRIGGVFRPILQLSLVWPILQMRGVLNATTVIFDYLHNTAICTICLNLAICLTFDFSRYFSGDLLTAHYTGVKSCDRTRPKKFC